MSRPKIVTIGVYGFSEADFFQALTKAKVEIFCDIRRRRGMRGSEYAFANSRYLQRKLKELGIRYVHLKELAPSREVRAKQSEADAESRVKKRSRAELAPAFIEAYQKECLSRFRSASFIEEIASSAEVVALFCVEREPEACHRSLVADCLHQELGIPVEHLKP